MDDNEKPRDNKDLMKDLDKSIENFLGKELINDINEAIDCFEADKKNAFDDLDDRLNAFLSCNYDLEEKSDNKSSISQPVKAGKETPQGISSCQSEFSENASAESEEEKEKKLRDLKIESDLKALKELVKSDTSSKKNNEPLSSENSVLTGKEADKHVEKQFTNKEIENALQELKAKSSGSKITTGSVESQKDDSRAIITDHELDSSLKDFLKKID